MQLAVAVYRRPRISIRLATGFIACTLALTGCYDDSPDPREIFGLEDASDSDLLPQVEEAIEVANVALTVEGRFILAPSWKPRSEKRGGQKVTVYFLRRPGLSANNGISKTKEALTAFRAELARVKFAPEFENCVETDPCAALMYAGTQMARLTNDVYQSSSAIDSAATESGCRCVMLIEDDILKFRLIFGPSISSGEPIVPLTWYIPWYALHEVGHRDSSFRLVPNPAWAALYERTQAGLNEQQKEEMRADAYAAATLGKACFVQPQQDVREAVSQACLGLGIQSLQFWIYGVFDKTDVGLRRQYLGDGRAHPNALMRILTMNMIMTDGQNKAELLLEDFMDKRETFAARFSQPAASN